jgi:hypothetical protein
MLAAFVIVNLDLDGRSVSLDALNRQVAVFASTVVIDFDIPTRSDQISLPDLDSFT